MPDVVKIGKTDRADVMDRVKELFTTSVPVPFDCVYACEVQNNDQTEKAMHAQFAELRIYPRREFFWLDTRKAVKALKSFELSDVTPNVRADADSKLSEEAKNARWKTRQLTEKKYPEYASRKNLHSDITK
jgi:hypothetical protein